MTDLSAMPDADLLAALQGTAPATAPGLSDMTDEQLLAAHTATAPQMAGAARAAALPASNVLKGAVSTLGIPGDIVRGIGYVGGKGAEATLDPDPMTAAMAPMPTTPQVSTPQMLADAPGKPNVPAPSLHNPLDSESLMSLPRAAGLVDRSDLQPQGPGERLEAAAAQGAGAALPTLLTGGMTFPAIARTLAQGAGGGLGGEVGGTAGQAVGGAPGRFVGTLAGSLLGGAPGSTIGAALPRSIDPETAALAQAAAKHGINVSIGQASESPFVKYADSTVRQLPFSGYGAFDAGNQTAFNRAVAGTFGETADKITPDVLNSAYQRIGGVYNGVAARTNIPASGALLGDLQGVVDHARLNMSADSVEPVQRQALNIIDTAANNNGVISGRQFKDLTAKGGPIDTLQGSSDSGLRQAGQQFETVLKSHLAANATPEDVAALQQADTQYKALKTIEPLTMRADTAGGATPSTGDISPAALRARVAQNYDNAARAPLGQLPLKDLAQIGQRFLKEPPNSGTPSRLAVQNFMRAGEIAGGGALGAEHLAGVPMEYSLPPLAASMLLPRAVGSVLRTPAIRPGPTPLAAALLGGSPQLMDPNATLLIAPPQSLGPATTANSATR
jgi:hypothetical protein